MLEPPSHAHHSCQDPYTPEELPLLPLPQTLQRLEVCKSKGFVGVDLSNLDAYDANNGLGLTAADQLAYNKWLAATAHGLGLAVGLKNDVGQIQDLVGDFDYFVNE